MSYLTDDAREEFRAANEVSAPEGQSLEEIVAANPSRRRILRGGMLLGASPLLMALGGCGADDTSDPITTVPPPTGATPPPPPAAAPVSYDVTFEPVAESTEDRVVVPEGYVATAFFSAGDPVAAGAPGYSGSFQSSADTELQAGGNHDGMHFFELDNVDPNEGGLLVVNHEYPDFNILIQNPPNSFTDATGEQRKLALSAVGVSVIEIAKASDDTWSVKKDSPYNRRYTGNSAYRVGGPAAGLLPRTITGTLNNCANGHTPWGTYLTCEETTNNYLDPSQPEEGYGWIVEIDPLDELGSPIKRTAMGRFDHENTDYLTDSNNRVAFYMGDDSTPGCIYKFVPSRAFAPDNRSSNRDLLDYGTLYVARFNGDGSGDWIELEQGKNGLTTDAVDPGLTTQANPQSRAVSFPNQASVLINTPSAARVAGGTLMDRPEWISVGPDKSIVVTLTNNSRRVETGPANPRPENRHGHIIRFRENGDSPLASTFSWEILLLAGDPSLTNGEGNLTGNISGDTFSSPDGIRLDPEGRLWVETDQSVPGSSGISGRTNVDVFGNNAMYNIDPTTAQSRRFLVGPVGCEITGIAYTPDLTTFFINIQHPTGDWPVSGQPPRSSTIAVRREDGKPIGA